MGDRSACDGRDASEAVEVSEQRADVPVLRVVIVSAPHTRSDTSITRHIL